MSFRDLERFLNHFPILIRTVNLTPERLCVNLHFLTRPSHEPCIIQHKISESSKQRKWNEKRTGSHSIILESSHIPLASILDKGKTHHRQFGDIHTNISLELDLSRSFPYERPSSHEECFSRSFALNESDEEGGRGDDAGFSNRMIREILQERGDQFGCSEIELGTEKERSVWIASEIRNDRFPYAQTSAGFGKREERRTLFDEDDSFFEHPHSDRHSQFVGIIANPAQILPRRIVFPKSQNLRRTESR